MNSIFNQKSLDHLIRETTTQAKLLEAVSHGLAYADLSQSNRSAWMLQKASDFIKSARGDYTMNQVVDPEIMAWARYSIHQLEEELKLQPEPVCPQYAEDFVFPEHFTAQ